MLGLLPLSLSLLGILPALPLSSALPASLPPPPQHLGTRGEPAPGPGDIQVGGVLSPALRAFVEDTMAFWRIPGAVVAVVDNGTAGVEVFGIKDVGGGEMTAHTYHAIASNSKWVTALALATMESWGNVSLPFPKEGRENDTFTLESKIKEIWPDFKMVDPNATEATVADFLTMRTGIPRHDQSIHLTSPLDPLEALRSISLLRPSAPYPTEIQQYSTIHYNALAALPPLLLNKTLDEFVTAYFYEPLGMDATSNATRAGETGKRGQAFNVARQDIVTCVQEMEAGGSERYNETEACRGTLEVFDFWTDGDGLEQEGGGAVLMTGYDMAKWARESLRPQVIPASALDAAYSAYALPATPSNPNLTYSLGVNNQPQPDGWVESFHGGALPGHNSAFKRDVAAGQAVFVVFNQDPHAFIVADVLASQLLRGIKGQEVERADEAVLGFITGGLYAPKSNSNSTQNGTETGAAEEGEGAGSPAPPAIALPPTNPSPVPENLTIEGTYLAPGYAPIVLTPLNASSPADIIAAGLAPWLFADANAAGLSLSGPAYVARWNASFTSHVVLTHFDGPSFNYTLLLALDKIGEVGDDGVPVPVPVNGTMGEEDGETEAGVTIKFFGSGPAVFASAPALEGGDDAVQGFGTFGPWWGVDALSLPVLPSQEQVGNGSAVRAAAAAWFEKQ